MAQHERLQRLGQPRAQLLAPPLRERVHLAVGLAVAAEALGFDSPPLFERVQLAIDLALRGGPERLHGAVEALLQRVAAGGLEREEAEDGAAEGHVSLISQESYIA
jgi:hypothetical protein